MIRKITAALMLPAFAAILFVGCGSKADLTEASAEWSKKAGEVSAKLADVQNAYNEVQQMHTSMPVADMGDDMKAVYEQGTQMLAAQEATLKTVSETLEAQKSAMQGAVEAGDKEAFDKAWTAASTAYDGAMTKLDAAANELNSMKEMAAKMHEGDAAAATGDEAAPADAAAEGDAPAKEEKAADEGSKEM